MPGKANAYALLGVKTDTVIVENNEISEKERKREKKEKWKERRKEESGMPIQPRSLTSLYLPRRKSVSYRDTCIPMATPLLTISKIQK